MKMPFVLNNEKGSVIVVALLLLVFLTLIGIGATTTSTTDIQIVRNEKSHKVAFYQADSGVYSTPKLISESIEQAANPTQDATSGTAININYLDTDDAATSSFYNELMGYQANDADRDIGYTLGNYNVQVDVQRDRAESLVGGGAEFGAGAEGVGVGATGGVAIYYDMDSEGNGPDSATSNVLASYRKVIGTAGGL